jgi:hypothetical protein
MSKDSDMAAWLDNFGKAKKNFVGITGKFTKSGIYTVLDIQPIA